MNVPSTVAADTRNTSIPCFLRLVGTIFASEMSSGSSFETTSASSRVAVVSSAGTGILRSPKWMLLGAGLTEWVELLTVSSSSSTPAPPRGSQNPARSFPMFFKGLLSGNSSTTSFSSSSFSSGIALILPKSLQQRNKVVVQSWLCKQGK